MNATALQRCLARWAPFGISERMDAFREAPDGSVLRAVPNGAHRVRRRLRMQAAVHAATISAVAIGLACITAASWINIKAFAAQKLIESAWTRTQQGETTARPWPWADTTAVARLTFNGRTASGEQRSQQKSFIVLEGSSGRNLAFAPTHDPASVLPGDSGNSVIAAHRDTHFSVLESTKVGDQIQIERQDGSQALFSVSNVQIADTRHTRIALNAATPRLTLITCYPFNAINPGGPLRFVVTADLIPPASNPPQNSPPLSERRATSLSKSKFQ